MVYLYLSVVVCYWFSQVEDQYSDAKQIYDELTDELYEELPSFYDRYEKPSIIDQSFLKPVLI